MKFLLHTVTYLAYFFCLFEYVLSTPIPRPRPKPLHEVHVDLIDTIFQIPIQTLNAVSNLIKNVHSAKRNFLSINVHVDKPEGSYYPSTPSYHSSKPDSYPSSKPDSSYPSKPEYSAGFPDYQPDYNPVLPGSSVPPVSVGVSFPGGTKPETPDREVNIPSSSTTGGIDSGLFTDNQEPTTASETSSGYKTSEPSSERVPPAPAVQPPYTRSPLAQPLSLDSGLNFDKPSNREKNFKEYVQRKLAEKNLQDNRISHSF